MIQRIDFLNADRIERSPHTASKIINYFGELVTAKLTVIFPGKFGWQLNKVDFNGEIFSVPADPFNVNQVYAIRGVDVRGKVRQGENNVTLHYAALPFDANTATAYLEIESSGIVSSLPNLEKEAENLWQQIVGGSWQVIVVLVLLAIIGLVAWRFLGGFF